MVVRSLLSILFSFFASASVRAGDHAPNVFLSHFFVVLDQASFDALRSSAQLSALAAAEDKHVEAGSRNWTGFYVRGRQTYMEFFGAKAPPEDARVGDCGLGLTVEERGGVVAIAALLRTAFGERVKVRTVPRATKSGTIPWFTAVEVESSGPEALETWIMEIDPGYLAAQHPDSLIEHPLGREQYLSWNFLPDHSLDDVVGLTAALSPSEMSQLARELEIVGWAFSVRAEDSWR
jgi:uncharacterized protein DUF5829